MKCTAEEVRANIAANRRYMTTETELQLTAYADTLSKPADSGMEAEREFFARDFYEEAREGKKAWHGQCNSGRVTDEGVCASLRVFHDAYCRAQVGSPRRIGATAAGIRAVLEAALAAQGQGEVACHRFVGPTGEVVTEWEDGLPDNGKRFPDLCPPVSSVQYAYFHPAPPASPAGVPDLVRFAIERCLRSQEALVASIDKANPDDPYASVLVAEDIEYLRAWLAAAPSAPEGE